MQSHLVKDICLIGAKEHRQLPAATLTEQMLFELESWCVSNKNNSSLFILPVKVMQEDHRGLLWVRHGLRSYLSEIRSDEQCKSYACLVILPCGLANAVSCCFFQGCGKSMIAREFADMLGYSIEPIMLYQVMSKHKKIVKTNQSQEDKLVRF